MVIIVVIAVCLFLWWSLTKSDAQKYKERNTTVSLTSKSKMNGLNNGELLYRMTYDSMMQAANDARTRYGVESEGVHSIMIEAAIVDRLKSFKKGKDNLANHYGIRDSQVDEILSKAFKAVHQIYFT